MQIDWFTLVAQIVNFLILLWLLQRFLYGPILRTMAAREEKLSSQFEAAEAKRQEAEEERNALAAERKELAERREELIQEARQEAAERRKQMIHEAREETETLKARWYDAIEREKQAFLRDVQTRMGEQLLNLVRRALADLAGVELEKAIVDAFLKRVENEAGALVEAAEESVQAGKRRGSGKTASVSEPEADPVTVRTTFELPEALEEEIREALVPLLAQEGGDGQAATSVTFEQADELVCGIEVEVHNRRIAWTIRDYLANLEQELDQAILQNGLLQSRRGRQDVGENGADEFLPG